MYPFSVPGKSGLKSARQRADADTDSRGYELISFDTEKINIFAAEVYYCEPHWHTAPELICVLSGEFFVTQGHTTSSVTAGSMIYINPDEIHSLEACVAGSKLITIQFSPNLFDEYHPAPQMEYTLLANLEERAEDKLIRDRVIELVEHVVNASPSFERIALIYRLLGTLLTAGDTQAYQQKINIRKNDHQLIKSSIEFINQHFDNELSLTAISDHAGVSYHHFSRVFKKISGYNFKEYLTIIRINKAKMLLKDTRIPITDISYTCGFTNHKQLISSFNKYCRMTPTQFRKDYITAMNFGMEQQVTTDFTNIPLGKEITELLVSFMARKYSI